MRVGVLLLPRVAMLAAARRAVEAGRSRCLVAAQWSRDGACAMGQGGVDGGEGCGGRRVCGGALGSSLVRGRRKNKVVG